MNHSDFAWGCGIVRGLRALVPISKGDEVTVVPIAQTLNAPEGTTQGCPKGLESLWPDVKGTTRVSLLLLLEWGKSDSTFTEYIGALPRPGETGTPFQWPDEFLNEFPYSPIVTSVKRQKEQWKLLFERVTKLPSYNQISFEVKYWHRDIVTHMHYYHTMNIYNFLLCRAYFNRDLFGVWKWLDRGKWGYICSRFLDSIALKLLITCVEPSKESAGSMQAVMAY